MCPYCERPHYEITLSCVGAKIVDYPKDSNDGEWVEVIFYYECPKCGSVWESNQHCHAS